MAYEFDPANVQVVATLLDRVAASADDLMVAWERLWADEQYKHLEEGLRAEIDFLFTYELQEDYESASGVNLVQSGLSLTATRPMSSTPTSAWSLWVDVSAIVENRMIGAHIADVLLVSRTKTKPEHATFTIASYLQAAGSDELSAQQTALSLARANSIARSRGMTQELSVREAMHLRAEALGNGPATSGPALTLLAALSFPPRDGAFGPGERDVLRTRLLALGETSNYFVDELGTVLARLAENRAELELARRWYVQQYLMFADASDHGMQKMHHAQTAADLASSYGLLDLRDAAVIVMQSVEQDSMGWKRASVEAQMSKNIFRAHLRRYRRARNWDYALMVFLASSSPSGDYEANIKTAARAASGSIRALVTRTVYGTHGLPERTDADFMEEETARTETMALGMSAILLALELEHVRDRFSPPSADRVAEWMVDRYSADPTLARHFAESLSLHWAGKPSDSARLSIPLIESAARGLLLTLDEPLYRTQRGESPGRFPAMDFYVDALAKRDLDPDWVRALQITLLSPGMNLRNLAAHGFAMDFTAEQSALLLRLAGLFCAMPTGVDRAALESPPAVVRGRLRRRLRWVWF